MQLKMQTDYAIRILIHLATSSGYVAKESMAKSLGIAPNYLPKVVRQLRDVGWVDSSVGYTGGYKLIKDPKSITLLDVMAVTEDTVKINRCLEPDGFCSQKVTTTCPVHQIYCTFQNISDQYFSHVSIHDLLNPRDVESYIGGIYSIIRQVSALKKRQPQTVKITTYKLKH